MRKQRYKPAAAFICMVLLLLCTAVQAQTVLSTDMEVRAKELFLELRCVVCQNQSIGDSDADVAKDLREIVRELMAAGKTNQEIRSFLVERYGEFILLKPVFALHTFILWSAPMFLLVLGGLIAWRTSRSRTDSKSTNSLSVDEQLELSEILNNRHK